MKRIIYILVGVFLFTSLNLIAQNKHEFSVSAAGGLSTLNYKTNVGERKNGLGGNIGVGYTYFLNDKIGIGTGAEVSLYTTSYKLDGIQNVIKGLKNESELEFDFHSNIKNMEETQNSLLVQIPLMLQYQGGNKESKRRFYASAGAKIGLPISGKYSLKNATFENKGYFPDADNWLEEPQFMGFGTFSDRKSKGDINLKTTYLLSAETGLKWQLKQHLHLYTGVYVDYGLSNSRKSESAQNLIAYNPKDGGNFGTNPILNSAVVGDNAKITKLVDDKITPISLGIKLRLSFGKASKAKAEEVPMVEIPKEEPKVEPKKEPQETPKAEEQAIVAVAKEEPKTEQKTEPKKDEPKADEKNKRELKIIINDYELSESKLSADKQAQLDKLITSAKGDSKVLITCTGYTCDLGTDAINYKLGLHRAESVKAYLVSKGIKASNVKIGSKGKTNFIEPNDSEENRKKNRRVEIVVNQ